MLNINCMKLKLGDNLISKIPGIKFHCFLVKNLNNLRKSSTVTQLLRGASVVARNKLKTPSKRNFFETYINHTLDPESTLLESYLFSNRIKKVQGDKEVDLGNNFANLLNYFSFKYFLPIFGFDLDQADGDYLVDFYESKKGKKAPELDFNIETRHAVFWFPNLTHLSEEDLEQIHHDIEANLNKYMFAEISDYFVLKNEEPSHDLGYTSEKELEVQRKSAEEDIFNTEQQTGTVTEDIIVNAIPVQEEQNLDLIPIPHLDGEKQIKNNNFMKNQKEENNLQDKLKAIMVETLLNYYKGNNEVSELVRNLEIETPKDEHYGDFACSIALKISKRLDKSSLDLATELKSILPKPDYIDEISVLPPGFINFYLSKNNLLEQLNLIIEENENYGKINLGKGEKVMIEYGSLNIAKPFGVHHLMTIVIGQSLVNLFRASGYRVIAADWPGDMGTQFGNLIYAYKTWGDRKQIEKDPITELLKLYIKFHSEVEQDPTLEEKGRAEYKKLEEKNPENLDIWKWIVVKSMKEADQIYATLGVKHDWRKGENVYIAPAQKLLEKFKIERKIIEGEKGAYIIKLEDVGLPDLLMQKADGTTLYATRDLASIEDRSTDRNLKKLIYVVDVAQTMHFNQVFAAAKKLGLSNTEMKHVVYGRMRLPEGSMSTRKGNIILGKDLLQEAINRAAAIIKEKGLDLNSKEQKLIAQEMGVSAVKYAMIVQAPESDFTFEWEKVMSFEGNSAPYLEYSLARAKSILRKADNSLEKNSEDQTSLFSIEDTQKISAEMNAKPLDNEMEIKLLKILIRYSEKLSNAVKNYKPNLFTYYLFEVAQTFNSFYQAIPVLRTENYELRNFRLKLVKGVEIVLENGLKTLGLSVFDRM